MIKKFEQFTSRFSEQDIIDAISNKDHIKVKNVKDLPDHDEENPVRPIDIDSDGLLTIEVDGRNYEVDLKNVTQINQINEDIEYDGYKNPLEGARHLKNHDFEEYFLDVIDHNDKWTIEFWENRKSRLFIRILNEDIRNWIISINKDMSLESDYFEFEMKTYEMKKTIHDCLERLKNIENYEIMEIYYMSYPKSSIVIELYRS